MRFGPVVLSNWFGIFPKAGIKITSTPATAVFINGKEVGKTPYQEESLKTGSYQVRIIGPQSTWQGEIKLTAGTLSVINRELGLSVASSSGEVLTLNEGQGVVVTSTPADSDVEIDGKVYGKTPLTVTDLSAGEHTFIISHIGFLKRSIRAALPEKIQLHLDTDLAVTESNPGSITAPPVVTSNKLTVKKTSTGFLRVRSKPTLNSAEVGRALSGESLTLIEESLGWMKVQMENGTQGYVASIYVQRVQ